MARAVQLAQIGAGKVSPNPLVGAVIVHDNVIIGEGWHRFYGTAHAEVNAIESVKDPALLSDQLTTLYVTLEPCHHYGKTPPCVDLILKHKIPRVVIGCQDPNPLVAGKSIAKMSQMGIQVVTDVLAKECYHLARFFFNDIIHKRPYVLLKYAASQNGKMGIVDQSVWLSNQYSKRKVHQLRSQVDAILVGSKTYDTDRPKLDTRYGYGKSPIRVILGNPISSTLPGDLVYNDPSDISMVLTDLYQKGIKSLLVEGGSKVLQSFIETNEWDECYEIKCPLVIIDQKAIPAPEISFSSSEVIKVSTDYWHYFQNKR